MSHHQSRSSKLSRGHYQTTPTSNGADHKRQQKISEYTGLIIEKDDKLILLGAMFNHEDLFDAITEGLGEYYYHAIVDMANGHDLPIIVDGLHEKLINCENT